MSLKFFVATTVAVVSLQLSLANAQDKSAMPIIRGPGVNQEQIEAIAEAQGQPTLAEFLDQRRPEQNLADKLRRLVERAQSLWLAGSVDGARMQFREITKLALEADWRPAQREAIHYAYLRLAQSSPLTLERDEHITKAVDTFPDLLPDEDIFPPPLVEIFKQTRQRRLSLAALYSPYENFPDYRFLIVNGKKYVISTDLKIRLPRAILRITALSDRLPPFTERLSVSQLEVFRVAMPAIAGGDCGTPSVRENPARVERFAISFSADCIRERAGDIWLPRNSELSEMALSKPRALTEPELSLATQTPAAPAISRKTWVWVGVSVLALGAAYAIHSQMNRETAAPSPAPTTVIEPVHRRGFDN